MYYVFHMLFHVIHPLLSQTIRPFLDFQRLLHIGCRLKYLLLFSISTGNVMTGACLCVCQTQKKVD